jgi:hypothetical protein
MFLETDKEELAILKEALANVRPKVLIVEPVIKKPKPNTTHEEKSGE